MSDDTHPFPDRSIDGTLPAGGKNPHPGGGTTEGSKLPPTPNAGRQPMDDAPPA